MKVTVLEWRRTIDTFTKRLALDVDGTRITLADVPGNAIRLTVIGAEGGPIIDLTMRAGPSGDG